jgi:hypothetical protein
LAKGNPNKNQKKFWSEERKQAAYLKSIKEESYAEEIENQQKILDSKKEQVDKALELFNTLRAIQVDETGGYGYLTPELQEQLKLVTAILQENEKDINALEELKNKENRRIENSKKLIEQTKEEDDVLSSIGNRLGKNSKLYQDTSEYIENQKQSLASFGSNISAIDNTDLKKSLVEAIELQKSGTASILNERKKSAEGSGSQADIAYSAQQSYKAFDTSVGKIDFQSPEFDTEEGKKMLSILMDMHSELKSIATEENAKLISGTDLYENLLTKVGNTLGKNSKLYEESEFLLDKSKGTTFQLAKIIESTDDEKLKKTGEAALGAYTELQTSIIETNVKISEGKATQDDLNKIIIEGTEKIQEFTNSISESTEQGRELKASFKDTIDEVDTLNKTTKHTQDNISSMTGAMDQFGSSGIPMANELSGVFKSIANKDIPGLKLGLMALGAALGALAAKTIFAPLQVGVEMFNKRIQSSIDLLRELGRNEVKFDQPVVQAQAGIDVGGQYIESAKKRKDSEVEIASIRRRLNNEIDKSRISNSEEILKLENDAANAAARASISFNSQLQQGAEQFKAAAKMALFGESLGPVKYVASQLQLAGVSADQIAASMGEATRALGQMPTSEVASDMAVFEKRIGASASEITDIADAMNLVDGYSLSTSLNMQAGLKTMAKQAKLNVGNLMKGMAAAAKNMLSYQIKSSSELAKQVAYAQSLGLDFNEIAGAGRNMVLNYKDSIKAEMKLSAMLGRSVDLSEVRQAFYEGRTDDAIAALKAQGLNPEDMDVFQQDQLAQTTGMDLNSLKKIFEREGVSTGPLKAGDITKENKEFLGKKQATEAALNAATATISAKTAILESKFSQKVLEQFLTDKDGKLKDIREKNFKLEAETAKMEADIAAEKIRAIAGDTSLQDMMKRNADLNAELTNLVTNLETQNKKILEAEAKQKSFDVQKAVTENIIPLVLSLVGALLLPKIGEMVMGGKGGGGIMSMFSGGGGMFSKLFGGGGAPSVSGMTLGPAAPMTQGLGPLAPTQTITAGGGGGVGGMLKGISPGTISNVATGLSGIVGAVQGYTNFESKREGETETRTTDKMGAGFVQGGLAVAGSALGAAFGGPLGAMIGGFLGNTLGGWINKNAPGIARMYGSMFEGIKSSFGEIGKVWDSTKQKFGQLFEKLEPVLAPIRDAFNSISAALGFEGEGLGGILKAVTKFVWDVFLTPFRALFGALGLVADMVGVVVKLFKGDWAGAWTDFKNGIGDFFSSIFAPFDNVIYGIKKAWAGVYNWIADSWLGKKFKMDKMDTSKLDADHKAKIDAEKTAEQKKKDTAAAKKAQETTANMGATNIQYATYTPQQMTATSTPAVTGAAQPAVMPMSAPAVSQSISKETEGAIQRSAGYLQQIVTRTQNSSAILSVIQSQADKRGIITLNVMNLMQSQAHSRGIIFVNEIRKAATAITDKIKSTKENTWGSVKASELVKGLKEIKDNVTGAVNRLLVFQVASKDAISKEAQNSINQAAGKGLKSASSFASFPAYATGTKSARGGMAMVGERGPELMYVPDSASIAPAGDTKRIQNGDVSKLSKLGIPGYEKGKVGGHETIDTTHGVKHDSTHIKPAAHGGGHSGGHGGGHGNGHSTINTAYGEFDPHYTFANKKLYKLAKSTYMHEVAGVLGMNPEHLLHYAMSGQYALGKYTMPDINKPKSEGDVTRKTINYGYTGLKSFGDLTGKTSKYIDPLLRKNPKLLNTLGRTGLLDSHTVHDIAAHGHRHSHDNLFTKIGQKGKGFMSKIKEARQLKRGGTPTGLKNVSPELLKRLNPKLVASKLKGGFGAPFSMQGLKTAGKGFLGGATQMGKNILNSAKGLSPIMMSNPVIGQSFGKTLRTNPMAILKSTRFNPSLLKNVGAAGKGLMRDNAYVAIIESAYNLGETGYSAFNKKALATDVETGKEVSTGRKIGNWLATFGGSSMDMLDSATFGLTGISEGNTQSGLTLMGMNGRETANLRAAYASSIGFNGIPKNKDLLNWVAKNQNSLADGGLKSEINKLIMLYGSPDARLVSEYRKTGKVPNTEAFRTLLAELKGKPEAERKSKIEAKLTGINSFNPDVYNEKYTKSYESKSGRITSTLASNPIGNALTKIIGRDKVQKGIEYLGDKGKVVVDKLKSTASNVFSGAKNMASNAIGGAKNMASSAFSGAKNMASSAWDSLTGFFAKGTNNAPGGPAVVGENGIEVVIPREQKFGGRALVNAVDSPDSRGIVNRGLTDPYSGRAIVNAFANGTNGAPGGMSLVGERGPEIVNLPKGAQVIPNHKLPDTLSSFSNGTPNAERLINQIQSEGINSGIPVQARLSDMISSDNANQVVNSTNIRTNAPQALHSEGLMNSMSTNTKLLNELNSNLKSYLQNNNNQPQNINLLVDGRVLTNVQFRREQNRKGMKPNDLV